MFIWSVQTVSKELTKHSPELASFINELSNSNDVIQTVAEKFPQLTPISIDYALMEKATRVLNIEATFDWDDVGSWISVAKYLDTQGDNNQTNTDDLIVVQTDDALLIANRHQADEIKKLGVHLPDDLL